MTIQKHLLANNVYVKSKKELCKQLKFSCNLLDSIENQYTCLIYSSSPSILEIDPHYACGQRKKIEHPTRLFRRRLSCSFHLVVESQSTVLSAALSMHSTAVLLETLNGGFQCTCFRL
jgi:hypothetical protein